jgi:hypothetical protein
MFNARVVLREKAQVLCVDFAKSARKRQGILCLFGELKSIEGRVLLPLLCSFQHLSHNDVTRSFSGLCASVSCVSSFVCVA